MACGSLTQELLHSAKVQNSPQSYGDLVRFNPFTCWKILSQPSSLYFFLNRRVKYGGKCLQGKKCKVVIVYVLWNRLIDTVAKHHALQRNMARSIYLIDGSWSDSYTKGFAPQHSNNVFNYSAIFSRTLLRAFVKLNCRRNFAVMKKTPVVKWSRLIS